MPSDGLVAHVLQRPARAGLDHGVVLKKNGQGPGEQRQFHEATGFVPQARQAGPDVPHQEAAHRQPLEGLVVSRSPVVIEMSADAQLVGHGHKQAVAKSGLTVPEHRQPVVAPQHRGEEPQCGEEVAALGAQLVVGAKEL